MKKINFISSKVTILRTALLVLFMAAGIHGFATVHHTVDPGAVQASGTIHQQVSPFNMDKRGSYEFTFGATRDSVYSSQISGNIFEGDAVMTLVAGNGIVGDTQRISTVVLPVPLALAYGDTIGSQRQFNYDSLNHAHYLYHKDSFNYAGTNYMNYKGHWNDTTWHFAGVAFKLNGNTHYGWMRLRIIYISALQVAVQSYDFAYEDIPGKAILAGDTVGADAVSTIVGSDVADHANGSDLNVAFNKATNENTVGEYRVIIVPDSLNNTFDFSYADTMTVNYTAITKTGSNISQVLSAAATDFQGNLIVNDKDYRIYVLSTPNEYDAVLNTLSGPSAIVRLTTAPPGTAAAATTVVATDVADNQNGSDLNVAFTKASPENTVGSYRILVVKNTAAGAFNLAAANAVVAANYTSVTPTGANISQALSATAKDADGDAIAEGVTYKVFVLSIADGTNATTNALSAPSDTVVLSHQVGISNIQPLENVEVYSNQNVVNVHFMDAANTAGTLTIFNATGEQVYANQISGDQHISLNNAAGVYVVNLVQNGKVLSKQLFISNK